MILIADKSVEEFTVPASVTGVIDEEEVTLSISTICGEVFVDKTLYEEYLAYKEAGVTDPDKTVKALDLDTKRIKKITISEGIKEIYGNFADAMSKSACGCYFYMSRIYQSEVVIEFPSTIERIEGNFAGSYSLDSINKEYYRDWYKRMTEGATDVVYAGKVAIAIPDSAGENITIKDGTVAIMEIAAAKNDTMVNLSVPSSLTEIGSCAFAHCSKLETITGMGDTGVTGFWYANFYKATALKSIDVPKTVEKFGSHAFDGCTSLKEVNIAEDSSLSYIDYKSFYDCESLLSFEIPEKVTKIMSEAFRNCTSLKTVSYKEGCVLEFIDYRAFYECTALESFSLPASTKTMGSEVFYNCKSLKTFNTDVNGKLESIEYITFYNCSSLLSFVLPSECKVIRNKAFEGCTSLETFTIPENSKLENIEYEAFGWHPTTYRTRNGAATGGGGYLDISKVGAPIKEIFIPGKVFATTYEYLESGNVSTNDPSGLFCGNTALTKVTIGAYEKQEGEVIRTTPNMFAGCENIESLTVNLNIDYVMQASFAGCLKVKSFDFTNTKRIMACAFADTGLEEIVIPECVEKIECAAFGGCTSLDTITIGTVLEKQGSSELKLADILGYKWQVCDNVFNGECETAEQLREYDEYAPAPTKIIIKSTSDGKCIVEGLENGYKKNSSGFFSYLPTVETVEIPKEVKTIYQQTFRLMPSLKSINLENIEDIGDQAFEGDISLDIDFSKLTKLKSIGYKAFVILDPSGACGYYREGDLADGYGLSEIILPEGLTTIGTDAFCGQRNVTKVVIPESVTSVSHGAFNYCDDIETMEIYAPLQASNGNNVFNDIFWTERNPNLKNVVLGEKYFVGENAIIPEAYFYDQKGLETCVIQGDNYANISKSMFSGCENLKEFTIGKGVKSIDQAAFTDTDSLKELIIPENVQYIEIEAFQNCGAERLVFENDDIIIAEPEDANVHKETGITYTHVTLYGDDKLEYHYAIKNIDAIVAAPSSNAEKYKEKHENYDPYKHEGTYSVDGNILIADSCGCTYSIGSATATITAISVMEDGTEKKTAVVTYDDVWTKRRLPTDLEIIYADNVKPGEATASIQMGDVTASVKFDIVADPDKPAEEEKDPDKEPDNKPATDPVVGEKVTDTASNAVFKVVSTGSSLEVTYVSTSTSKTEIAVPDTVKINNKTYKVTSIEAKAFANNKKLKKIVIGKNIKKIGAKAFYNCKNLKKVIIKSTKLTKKTVGKSAFAKINKKAVIKVPKKKLKAYKKLLKARGIKGKSQKIKK